MGTRRPSHHRRDRVAQAHAAREGRRARAAAGGRERSPKRPPGPTPTRAPIRASTAGSIRSTTWTPIRAPSTCTPIATAAASIGAIENQADRLRDPKASHDAKVEALRLVAHFVGDVHQPLHVAHPDMRGGTTIDLRFDGREMTLHRLWDSELLTRRLRERGRRRGPRWRAYAQSLADRTPPAAARALGGVARSQRLGRRVARALAAVHLRGARRRAARRRVLRRGDAGRRAAPRAVRRSGSPRC